MKEAMPNLNIEHAVVFVATAVFVILSFLPALVPSHRLLFILFFLYLVMAPGWLLSRRIVPWAGGILRAASAFVLGTALAFVILFFVALADGDIRLVRIVVPAIVVLLSLARPRANTAAADHAAGLSGAPFLDW